MNKTNDNFRENTEELNMGKMPEKTTPEGNTKPITLSVKLTAEENSRFTAALERNGFSSKTDYVKQRLFQGKPIMLEKGREIFEKLSECVDLLHDLNENNSVDRQQDIKKITEQLSKIEADISYTWDCIDAANNGKDVK